MNFYSRPCGRGDGAPLQASRPAGQFLLTPLREGRPDAALQTDREDWISTHAPAGGATDGKFHIPLTQQEFLLTPLREGRPRAGGRNDGNEDHFYSRPCGRGDFVGLQLVNVDHFISTHAPAGGATFAFSEEWDGLTKFLLTPLREGRQKIKAGQHVSNLFLLTPLREGRLNRAAVRPEGSDFYSRPCGRGDRNCAAGRQGRILFLLTPLREGRRKTVNLWRLNDAHFYSRPCGRGDDLANGAVRYGVYISTHAPAGGATKEGAVEFEEGFIFLLTPLREGRHKATVQKANTKPISTHAPAGGATEAIIKIAETLTISTHAPAGGATQLVRDFCRAVLISTHAPAGGATQEVGFPLASMLLFLLTPLREGRRSDSDASMPNWSLFLLTPLREGRLLPSSNSTAERSVFLLTPLREGRLNCLCHSCAVRSISTHAPAGGATHSVL